MKLEKKVYFCTECALGYYKQLWEPMWFAKFMWKSAHKQEHTLENITNVSQDYRNGLEDERDRIIKIIKERSQATSRDALIAVIKGENK